MPCAFFSKGTCLKHDTCHSPEHGEEAIKELHADFNIPASFYRVDVRDPIAVEEAINGIVRDFGSIDVLLCSAGTSFTFS